jgi:leucyl aminopeptidase
MNFELLSLSWAKAATLKTDALVVLVSDDQQREVGLLSSMLDQAQKTGDFTSAVGQCMVWWKPPSLAALRLVLVGVGKGRAVDVRQGVAAGIAALKKSKAQTVAVVLHASHTEHLVVAAQAVADASYVYTATKPSAKALSFKKITLGVPQAGAVQTQFDLAKAQMAGVALAREWGNRPANHATPDYLAQVAKSLAKHSRISCEVMGLKEVTKLGMGSFAAVAQASAQPLRFIVLKYKGAADAQAPTVLVGKGITFDTGGISLKPGPGMD